MASDEKTLRIKIEYEGSDRPPVESPNAPRQPGQPNQPGQQSGQPGGTPQSPPNPQAPASPPKPVGPSPTSSPSQPQPGQPQPQTPPGQPQTQPSTPPASPPASPPTGLPPTPPEAPTPPSGGGRITPRGSGGSAAPTGPAAASGGAFAGTLGTAAIAVGVVTEAFGALYTATTLVSAEIGRLTDKLRGYDPGIAQAGAASDMRKIQADMRQAADLSEEMQGFISKQTTLELTAQRIETSITKTLAPAVIKLLDIAQTVLDWILITVEVVRKIWEKIQDWLKDHPFIKFMFENATGIAFFRQLKELAGLLMKWLNIQLDEYEDAAVSQKDLLDALNPHGDAIEKVRKRSSELEAGVLTKGRGKSTF